MSRTTPQRATAVGAAAVAALVLWAGTGGAPVLTDGRHIGAAAVLVTTVVVGLAGWALLAVLERTTRHAPAIWVTVATLVFGLSLLPVAGAAKGSDLGALLGLHTIVYVVLTVAFWRSAQSVSVAQRAKPVV